MDHTTVEVGRVPHHVVRQIAELWHEPLQGAWAVVSGTRTDDFDDKTCIPVSMHPALNDALSAALNITVLEYGLYDDAPWTLPPHHLCCSWLWHFVEVRYIPFGFRQNQDTRSPVLEDSGCSVWGRLKFRDGWYVPVSSSSVRCDNREVCEERWLADEDWPLSYDVLSARECVFRASVREFNMSERMKALRGRYRAQCNL